VAGLSCPSKMAVVGDRYQVAKLPQGHRQRVGRGCRACGQRMCVSYNCRTVTLSSSWSPQGRVTPGARLSPGPRAGLRPSSR
jgi:hypothetical protein